MAVFHGVEFIENEKLNVAGSGFPASYASDSAYTVRSSLAFRIIVLLYNDLLLQYFRASSNTAKAATATRTT
jgi:hypothetical protein